MVSSEEDDDEEEEEGDLGGNGLTEKDDGDSDVDRTTTSSRKRRRRLRNTGSEDKEEEETPVLHAIQQQQQAQQPPVITRRLLVTMARDIILILFGYMWLFCPPNFVSDNLNGLGMASDTLASRKAPPPEPFFSAESASWVDDYYGGDIFAAFEEAQRHRDAFFMFYAPWDEDCARAKDAFGALADALADHTDLYFAAVNCWTATGECFKEFGAGKAAAVASSAATANQRPKGALGQFPIFVFYPRDRRGVQYHGPVTAGLLAQFVTNAQNPLQVLGTREDLLRLRASSNGVALVGYFADLNPAVLGTNYRRFLQASYDLLELDPFRTEVGPLAAVVSPTLAFQLQLSAQQPVRYFHWNSSSVAYPNKTITSVASLVNWSWTRSRQKLTTWVGTTGRKSLKLSKYLRKGSGVSLLAFIPRMAGDPLHYNRALSVLQETALKYFSCSNSSFSRSSLLQQMEYLRKTTLLELEFRVRECAEDPWFERNYCARKRSSDSDCMNRLACRTNGTSLLRTSPNEFLAQSFATESVSGTIPEDGGPTSDSHVLNLRVYQKRLQCSLLAASQETCELLSPSTLDDDNEDHFGDEIDGLGCWDNRSLNFYTLDSGMQRELAESFGADLSGTTASVVIADIGDESLYQMSSGPFHAPSLRTFIRDFHGKSQNLTRLRLNAKVSPIREEEEQPRSRPLSVRELNRLNFESVVLNATENVVLLYHSTSCGLCASYAYSFHAAAHLLSSSDNLTFAVVDAGKNDLPWHFTALSVPSILFFPAGGEEEKSETRAFPANKAISVPNLLSFVVANLPEEGRRRLSVALCDDDCLRGSRAELASRMDSIDFETGAESFLLPQMQELDLALLKEQEKRSAVVGDAESNEEYIQNIDSNPATVNNHVLHLHNEL